MLIYIVNQINARQNRIAHIQTKMSNHFGRDFPPQNTFIMAIICHTHITRPSNNCNASILFNYELKISYQPHQPPPPPH